MQILITGVSGFLGGRLAQAFSRAGHAVRGLVRDPSRWTDRPAGAEVATGDVVERATIAAAAEGCEAIVHAAALVKLWVRDRRSFDRVNVDGLANVLSVARERGARVLWASSFFALGPTDGRILDVDDPRMTERFCTPYERTKWIADQLARRVPASDVDLVRLYPGILFGPGSLTEGNYVVRMLAQHARGKLPGLLGRTDLRQCLAFVDDVAEGFVLALERAAPGSGYVLGGENVTTAELFARFARLTGVTPPRRIIPFGIATALGAAQRAFARLTGVTPQLTDESVEVYKHEWAYTSERAVRDLDYRITPFDEALRSTVEWMRTTGELR